LLVMPLARKGPSGKKCFYAGLSDYKPIRQKSDCITIQLITPSPRI